MAFQKGKSGNPNGRPKKGKTFTEILEKVLHERTGEIETLKGKKTVHGKEVLANVLYEIAADKTNAPKIRLDAINIIMNRIDGKPMQQTEEMITAKYNHDLNCFMDIDAEYQKIIGWKFDMASAEGRKREFNKLMGYDIEETSNEIS